MSENPIEQTKNELIELEKERDDIHTRLKVIEFELSYRRKLVETWDMVLSSDLLKQNLLKQISADNIPLI